MLCIYRNKIDDFDYAIMQLKRLKRNLSVEHKCLKKLNKSMNIPPAWMWDLFCLPLSSVLAFALKFNEATTIFRLLFRY